MSEGGYCKHHVNVFDPRGCAQCTAEMNAKKPVTKANGHVPVGVTFGKKDASDDKPKDD